MHRWQLSPSNTSEQEINPKIQASVVQRPNNYAVYLLPISNIAVGSNNLDNKHIQRLLLCKLTLYMSSQKHVVIKW